MKISLFFIVAFFYFSSVSAQRSATEFQFPPDYLAYNNGLSTKVISGSIYAENEFVKGEIVDAKSNESKQAFLRYNALEDLVEIKLSENSEIQILPKVKNLEYHFTNYAIVLDDLKTQSGTSVNGYVIKYFNEEDVKFLAKPVLTGKKKRFGIYPGSTNIFVDYEYYLQKGNETKQIKLANNNLKKLFPDERMEDYFKNNTIKSESDVVAMLKFYTEI